MIKFYVLKNLKKLLKFNPLKYSTYKTVDLAYTTFGDADGSAPPLIIHHALFGTKNNWRSICLTLKNKLQPERKIIAIDARNHGASPHLPEHTYQHLAADLKRFLKKHNIDKAALLGHSMGGRAVMYLALSQPDLVERAIIVDVSPINMPNRNLDEYKTILEAMMKTQINYKLNIAEGRAEAKQQMKDLIENDFVLNFILQQLRKDEDGSFKWTLNVEALYKFIEHITIFPTYVLQNKFPNQVLFIAGRRSDFVAPGDWPIIQETFPNSKLVWLDTGHLVHIEQPDQTATLIADFLNN